MKKSQLKKIIKEEIRKVLKKSVNEGIFDRFKRRKEPSFDEPAWYESIAKAALAQLQQHHKWKEMELAAMGPGNSKTYMNMAITPSKYRGPEYEFKVHFDENEKVTKIEDQTPEWRI